VCDITVHNKNLFAPTTAFSGICVCVLCVYIGPLDKTKTMKLQSPNLTSQVLTHQLIWDQRWRLQPHRAMLSVVHDTITISKIFILKIQDSILYYLVYLQDTFEKYLDKEDDTFHKILFVHCVRYSTRIISQPFIKSVIACSCNCLKNIRVCTHYMVTWNDNNTGAQVIQ